MAEDFICGLPPVVTISGQSIKWDADEVDTVFLESFTASDYVAFTGGSAATFAISSNDGAQPDGTYQITVTGDISGYASGTDRATPKIGSAVNHYTSFSTCKAPMNGVDDRMLISYSDTDKNTFWRGDLNSGPENYNPTGIIANAKIAIAAYGFLEFTDDMSSVGDMGVFNLTFYGSLNRIIYYRPSVDITGTFTISRCRFLSVSSEAIRSNTLPTDKLVVESCYFEGLRSRAILALTPSIIRNCTFVNTFVNVSNTASKIKNCTFINTELENGGSATITTCLDTMGIASAATTLEAMKTWATEAYGGPTHNYYPASELSPLVGTGTDCAATHDIHGRAFTAGSYPIGASLLFDFTDPSATDPDACTIESITAGDTQLTISITDSPDASAVIYARVRTASGTWSDRTFSRTGDGDLTITGLTNGTPYGVVAEAYHGGFYSEFSNEVFATPTDGANDATGPYASAVEKYRAMLAASATWQELCGVATAEEALAKTYYEVLPEVSGQDYNTTLKNARPVAAIGPGDNGDWKKIAAGLTSHYSANGEVWAQIELDIPTDYAGIGQRDEAMKWASRMIDAIISEINQQSGTAGLLTIKRHRTMMRPQRGDHRHLHEQDDFYRVLLAAEWGSA